MKDIQNIMKAGAWFGFVVIGFAFLQPCELYAQDTNVKARNNNRSIKLKSIISSGSGNQIPETNTYASFIGGGQLNKITSRFNSTIGGGYSNSAIGSYNVIGGGSFNTADDWFSAVLGGSGNYAADAFAVICGGNANLASDNGQTIGGGRNNIAGPGNNTVIAGGRSNTTTGSQAVIGGGELNVTLGEFACIPGGASNSAAGCSFAAGVNAKSTNQGSFVWSGVSSIETVSTNTNSFTVRAPGGVRFITTLVDSATVPSGAYSNASYTNGVFLAPNSGAWASLSDSNAKTKVTSINPREILAKLGSMPVTEWEYKADPNRRYIGPMAQDFHAAFGLGADDKSITTLDSDGVMYAAIQGLLEELRSRDRRIEELESKSAEVETLRTKMENLEKRLNSLPPSP